MRTRRSRTRTRKTELLSLLRLDHSTSAANMGSRARQHQQLKLFPLHPETANGSAEDTEGPHDYDENVNVSLLFSGDNTSATTLCGLLSDGEATIPVTAAAVACSEEGSIGSHGSLHLISHFSLPNHFLPDFFYYIAMFWHSIFFFRFLSSRCIPRLV